MQKMKRHLLPINANNALSQSPFVIEYGNGMVVYEHHL